MNTEDMERIVNVTVIDKVTALWDGKEYELSPEPIRVQYGVALHWKQQHDLSITETEQQSIAEREIVNPLEANDRGAAFAGLKRPGRKKASGE